MEDQLQLPTLMWRTPAWIFAAWVFSGLLNPVVIVFAAPEFVTRITSGASAYQLRGVWTFFTMIELFAGIPAAISMAIAMCTWRWKRVTTILLTRSIATWAFAAYVVVATILIIQSGTAEEYAAGILIGGAVAATVAAAGALGAVRLLAFRSLPSETSVIS